MKTLREYFEQKAATFNQPQVGDTFAINAREECLLETYVCDQREDGIVIHADEKMMSLMEGYGWLESEEMDECDYDIDSEESEDDVIEPEDRGEYDQEGAMAKDDLHTIVRAARRLNGMLDDEENMPEWVQSKINKAADYIDTAADYIESNKEQEISEDNNEPNPVARAVLNRILMQHPGVLATHGPQKVMDAIDELADYVNIGPDDEIGSSDVSAWTRDVIRMLAELPDEPLDEQGVAEDVNTGPQIIYATGPRTMGMNDVDLVFKDLRTGKIVAHVVGNNYHPGDDKLQEFAPPAGGGGGGDDNQPKTANYEIRMNNSKLPTYLALGDPQEDTKHKVYKLVSGKTDGPTYYGMGMTLVSKLDWWSFLEKMLGEIMWEDDAIEAGYVDRQYDGDLVFVKQQGVAEGSGQYRVTLTLKDDSAGPGESATQRVNITVNAADEQSAIAQAKQKLIKSPRYSGSRIVGAKIQQGTDEAKYQGREVPLGKPMKGDVKKSKVYVRGPKGNVVKVNFGDPNMRIKKTSPKHRKSFRARHHCDNPGPRWKARYWSCRAW